MTPATFEHAMKSRLQRQPFQPFLIELNDGEQWVVGQREAVMYVEGPTANYFRVDGNFDFVDCENVKQLLDLVPATPG